jgi:cell division septum initiation protein DivIVA
MQQAYYQANEMVSNASAQAEAMIKSANDDAEQIRTGALAYTNEILSEVENILTNAFESTRTRSDALVNSLKSNLDVVVNNKRELADQLNPAPVVQQQSLQSRDYQNEVASDSEAYEDGEYDFDENTFLEDID